MHTQTRRDIKQHIYKLYVIRSIKIVLRVAKESNSVGSLMVSYSHFWEDVRQEAIMPVKVWTGYNFETPIF